MTLIPNIPQRARIQRLNTVERIVSRNRATYRTSKYPLFLPTPDDVYTMCVAHNLSLPLCYAICHHETTTHIINFHFPTNLVLDVNRLFRPHSTDIIIPLTLIPILCVHTNNIFSFILTHYPLTLGRIPNQSQIQHHRLSSNNNEIKNYFNTQ